MSRAVRVVVVGGGIAGASAAWHLAEHADVVLVEMEAVAGYHATGRSAAVLSETSGTAAVCALAAASRTFLAAWPLDDAPVLSPRGLLWVARDESSTTLAAIERTARSLGVRADSIDPASARSLVPALRPDWLGAALHEPDAMTIDVALVLAGYLRGLRSRGGTVRLASPALALAPTASGWRVDGAGWSEECDVVVDAAGAWADDVARRAGVAPLGLAPMSRTAFTFPVEGTRGWPLVMDVAGQFYFEPEGPGLLASPADETPVDPGDATADELAIARAVDALAAATTLEVRGVRSAWAGLRTFAPDRSPVVGQDPDHPGFFWLAGQGGAGIKTAPAMAALVAALILDAGLPHALAAAGVVPGDLAPSRLR